MGGKPRFAVTPHTMLDVSQPIEDHMVSKNLRNTFILLVPIGIIHCLEQWLFGFNEAFAVVKAYFLSLQVHFDPPEKAFMIVAVFLFVSWYLTTYILLRGGKGQYGVLIFFGVLSFSEIHHIFSALREGKYIAGTGTGVVFAAYGLFLIYKTIAEMRISKLGLANRVPRD